MFISDNETAVDLLYYEAIAKTIVGLINESAEEPMSIGIHGDWGAGKSSILLMTEKAFSDSSDILCLRFNGWQFQGFEDAKAALLEKIVIELRDARPEVEKVKEKAKDLLKRIDYLKLGKKALPWAFTVATGIPHPWIITDAIAALRGSTSGDNASVIEGLEGLLKPGQRFSDGLVNDSFRGRKEPRIIIGCNVLNVNYVAAGIDVAKESLHFFRSQPLDRGQERPLVVIWLKLIVYKYAVAFFTRHAVRAVQ
jgi:hypothetical protein